MNLRVEQDKSNEIIPKTDKTESSAFLQKIRDLAKEMEIFPISFIARNGPLSNWDEGGVSYRRIELSEESFRIFYEFCQLALDAAPDDIDTCLNHLDIATPREQALLMTVMYIYIYPWESQKPIGDLGRLKWENSWFSLQFVTNAFDLTVRQNQKEGATLRNACLTKIREYVDDDTIVFPAITFTKSEMIKNEGDFLRFRGNMMDICLSTDWAGPEKLWDSSASIPATRHRAELLQKIREKFPENYRIVIADTLYAFHNDDTLPPVIPFRARPSSPSIKAKTVGQVAQQLLKSWNTPPTTDLLNNQ